MIDKVKNFKEIVNENIENKRTNSTIWYHGSSSPKLTINTIKINDNSTSLVFLEVASNCGVRSYNGVNFLFENCDQNIDLFRKVMNQVLDLIIEEGRCCMVLFSTNDEYEDIWTVLDEIMDTRSQIVEDPNSELDVKLWIKYTN